MNKEKKYKLSRVKKQGIIIGVLLIVAAGGTIKFTANIIPNKTNTDTKKTNTETIQVTQTPATSGYININKNNELTLYNTDRDTIPITLNNYDYLNFIENMQKDTPQFSMAQYYGLDETLKLYNNTEYKKSTESNLLDQNGNLDSQKLYNTIKNNNKKKMNDKVNAINTFYTNTSEKDLKYICNLITAIVNSQFNNTEIKQVANTLTQLTIFNRTGCVSNAYLTEDLTLVYNPTMTEMYSDMQEINGNYDNLKTTLEAIITHEALHIMQNENNDLLKENGIETGISRMYNISNEPKKVKVDSLHLPWILEGSAELGMADYLNIPPGTYKKKIAYINSYNLSRFHELDQQHQALEKIAFNNTLEEAYKNLELLSEEEKRKFLEFMFSVEIIQSNPADFWENYSNITGIVPTEEEKNNIRLNIRQEVVKYMTQNFYQNLANAIQEKKITDIDSAFYLMTLWEIDSYNHLEYTKESSLEYAEDFIKWQENSQNYFFEAISNSSKLSKEEIKQLYNEYHLHANINGIVYDNCNLNNLSNYAQENILSKKDGYVTSNFVKNNTMFTYITTQKDSTEEKTHN